jgi:hypothetical protein
MPARRKKKRREKAAGAIPWLENAPFVQALKASMTDPEALMRLGEVKPRIRRWLLAEHREVLNLDYLATNDLAGMFSACVRCGFHPSEQMFVTAMQSGSFTVAQRIISELELSFDGALALLGVPKQQGYPKPDRSWDHVDMATWVVGFRPKGIERVCQGISRRGDATEAEEKKTLFTYFAKWGEPALLCLAGAFAAHPKAFEHLASYALTLQNTTTLDLVLAFCRRPRNAVVALLMEEAETASWKAFKWAATHHMVTPEDVLAHSADFARGVCRGSPELLRWAVEGLDWRGHAQGPRELLSDRFIAAVVEGRSLELLRYLVGKFNLTAIDLAPGLARFREIQSPEIKKWIEDNFGQPVPLH